MWRGSTVLPCLALVAAGLACARRAGPHVDVEVGGDSRLAPAPLSDGLQVATPEQVGLRRSALVALLADTAADKHRDLESLLVSRRGQLVLEAYFNGADRETLHDVRSVGKSITGTLVGIALHEGRIRSLDQPFLDFFPGRRQAGLATGQAAVTIRHLLEMRSGIAMANDWDQPPSPSSEDRMVASPDWLRYALDLPLAGPPGQKWAYASLNTMLLGRLVSAATGRDLESYAREHLFDPLQFGRYRWERDPKGNVVGQGALWVRPRDLLKLGLLYLQGGKWRERQLVPASWIEEATRPHLTLPVDPTTGQGEFYKGYGYQWWTSDETLGGKPVAFYLASGNGGQRLFVVPSLELVVVVTSTAYQRGRAHRRSHGLFRQVLAATQ